MNNWNDNIVELAKVRRSADATYGPANVAKRVSEKIRLCGMQDMAAGDLQELIRTADTSQLKAHPIYWLAISHVLNTRPEIQAYRDRQRSIWAGFSGASVKDVKSEPPRCDREPVKLGVVPSSRTLKGDYQPPKLSLVKGD